MVRFKKLFSAGLLALCLMPVAQADPELKILADVRPPYAWLEKGVAQGINYDLVSLTMQEMKLNQPIEFTSFSRGLQMAQTKPNTAFFSASLTPERQQTLKFVGPLVQSDVYIYKLKQSPVVIKSIDDLYRLPGVGVPRGMNSEAWLTKKGIPTKQFADTTKMILGLKNQRVEAVISGQLSFRASAYEAGLDPDIFEQTPIKLYENSLYIAFSKNVRDETIQRWQTALDKVKHEHFARLSSKYLH